MDELRIQWQRRPGGPGFSERGGAQGLDRSVLVSLSNEGGLRPKEGKRRGATEHPHKG